MEKRRNPPLSVAVNGNSIEFKNHSFKGRVYLAEAKETNILEVKKAETDIGWVALTFYDEYGNISENPTSLYKGSFSKEKETFLLDIEHGSVAIKRREPLISATTSNTTEQSNCEFGSYPHLRRNVLTKRAESDCQWTKKILYMGVAADCTFYSKHLNIDETIKSILSIWNQVSSLYERTFNVEIGLIDVQVNTICNTSNGALWNRECVLSYSMSDRLSDFSKWRGLTRNKDAGLWHLLTACNSLPLIGLSWGNMVCMTGLAQNNEGKYISGVGLSSISSSSQFHVVAHEIGHNFGASHDCVSGCGCSGGGCNKCCPCSSSMSTCDCNGNYLMNPTSESKTTEFSPCSIQEICTNLAMSGDCLQEPNTNPKVLFSGQKCGNGIKEGLEECDCGNEVQCADNPCCNPDCTLKSGAQCYDGNGACCKNCKIVEKDSAICRSANSLCDVEERCNGVSIDCPKDSYKQDGSPCGANLYCASGQCTNREDQCKMVARRFNSTGECSNANMNDCEMNCNTNIGCIKLPNYFLDGTECLNGRCLEGYCRGNVLHDFIYDYKYPIIFGTIGIIALFVIITVTVHHIKKRRQQNRK